MYREQRAVCAQATRRPKTSPGVRSVLSIVLLISLVLVLLLFVTIIVLVLVVVLIVVTVILVLVVVLHDALSFRLFRRSGIYATHIPCATVTVSPALKGNMQSTPYESKYLYSICSKISFVVLMVTPKNAR
jgi:hypothetical protein